MTFRATYTGDYFVDMRGMDLPAGYFPGSPSFAVDKDCKADRKTRCTLPVGATRSGRLLNYLYDDDWYRMPLKGGVSYRVTAAPEAGTGYSPKPMIHVLSPTGTELAKGVLGNATQDVQFTVPTTGSYFLLVYDDFTNGNNPHGQQARYTVSPARR